MSLKQPKHPRLIARQLALGFGSVSIVAVAMCLMLLATIEDVAGLVTGMEGQEPSILASQELATAVREQSLHIAHTVIVGNETHTEHYAEWRRKVRDRIQRLAGAVTPSQAISLELLGEKTQRMHELFESSVLPAIQAGDRRRAESAHEEVDRLSQQAAELADGLAVVIGMRMHHSHRKATSSTRRGMMLGGLCAVIVLALAVGFTLRLRQVVLKPLFVLTESARQFARGDFAQRVGTVGVGEIAQLAEAFDHMAEELAIRESRLVRQERMAAIGQLAAGVAHELNNPIGIIRGYLKTMSPEDDPNALREELAILDEEAAQCQRIAEDLLSYARSSELTLEPVEMNSFLRETVLRFASSRDDEPTTEIAAAPWTLSIDRARIRQVMLNLLGNAAQLSAPSPRIRIDAQVVSACYRIDVADNGPGISVEDRGKIFEPFFSKRKGGSGLGLAVVSGIVRNHGGTVEVIDSPQGGALFRIELPLSGPPASSESLFPEVKV